MNKIALSLIALAAISTASFAGSNRSNELRDSPTYVGKYSEQVNGSAQDINAFAVANSGAASTNFKRLTIISLQNTMGRH